SESVCQVIAEGARAGRRLVAVLVVAVARRAGGGELVAGVVAVRCRAARARFGESVADGVVCPADEGVAAAWAAWLVAHAGDVVGVVRRRTAARRARELVVGVVAVARDRSIGVGSARQVPSGVVGVGEAVGAAGHPREAVGGVVGAGLGSRPVAHGGAVAGGVIGESDVGSGIRVVDRAEPADAVVAVGRGAVAARLGRV